MAFRGVDPGPRFDSVRAVNEPTLGFLWVMRAIRRRTPGRVLAVRNDKLKRRDSTHVDSPHGKFSKGKGLSAIAAVHLTSSVPPKFLARNIAIKTEPLYR